MTIKESGGEQVSPLKYGPGLLGPVHDPEAVREQLDEVMSTPSGRELMEAGGYAGSVLRARRIAEILSDSLFDVEEITEDGESVRPEFADQKIDVTAIKSDFGFHKGRLEAYRDEIKAMISCLPSEFYQPENGWEQWGLSFLLLAQDKDGQQWGEYIIAEQLYALSAGLALAKILLPEFMWGAAPGGMPYIVFANPKTGELPKGFGEK